MVAAGKINRECCRCEEPVGDSTLIEDLDGARVKTAGARADEVLAGGRSTMATSTPANVNSPANIGPVGPPPAIRR